MREKRMHTWNVATLLKGWDQGFSALRNFMFCNKKKHLSSNWLISKSIVIFFTISKCFIQKKVDQSVIGIFVSRALHFLKFEKETFSKVKFCSCELYCMIHRKCTKNIQIVWLSNDKVWKSIIWMNENQKQIGKEKRKTKNMVERAS